jgi:hypothetical protein
MAAAIILLVMVGIILPEKAVRIKEGIIRMLVPEITMVDTNRK